MKVLLTALLAIGLALTPAWAGAASAGQQDQKDDKKEKKEKKDKKDKKDKRSGDEGEGPTEPRDVNREITRMLRDLQFALEGGSARSLLSLIDSARFDDYPRFEDMVERLMREDSIRAHFRQLPSSTAPGQGKAQTIVDAEMELSRKDGAGQVQRRRQQVVLDFERTRRGWRIINITPRNYFEPL